MRRVIAAAAPVLMSLGACATMASAQTGVPVAERFVLSGVIIMDNGEGRAWLQEPTFTHNQVVTRREGDSVGPWRVARIFDNRVELEGPGGTVIVPLHNTGGAGSAGPAASAAVAARSQAASLREGAAEVAEAGPDPAARRAERLRARAAAREARGEALGRTGLDRRSRERRDEAASARQGGAAESSHSSFTNPNVISISPGDARRRGFGALLGGQ